MASAPLTAPPARAVPASCAQLFTAFTRLALQGFGGVLPVAQHELVERLGWVDRDEFLRILSVAQVLPGPNVVNLSLMIGDRFFGGVAAMEDKAHVERAMKLKPNDPAILDSWGWLQYRRRNLDEAAIYLQRAYRLMDDPDAQVRACAVWAFGCLGADERRVPKPLFAKILVLASDPSPMLREAVTDQSFRQLAVGCGHQQVGRRLGDAEERVI